MTPSPVKKYTVTGSRWDSRHLELQQNGIPFLWVNANNKYGPWKDPYVTIHTEAQNGEIVAAAKMGPVGWSRDFRIYLGNPDCTDLETWKVVKCKGKSAYEYRFTIGGPRGEQKFAWRRTRNKQLGAQRKGHRDFKLVAFGPPPSEYNELEVPSMHGEKLIPLESDEDEVYEDDLPPRTNDNKKEDERIVGIYFMDTYFKSSSREAKINFFENLPKETELWCLAAVLGLQEKISKNQDVMFMSSFSYGGGLRALGNYI